MVTTETDAQQTRITLAPNRSAEWSEIKLWLIFLSLPAMIVGIGWFVVGVWIILPFVGLELGLLAFFMYRICYQNYRQQHITIAKNHVTVESGVHTPNQHYQFNRPDCYLAVSKPAKPIDNLELTLTSQTQSLPIGDFLNPADRELARRSLVSAGLVECSSRWWDRSK